MIINSSLCYIEKDGRYLMLHRVKKKNDINKDKWIGVGGRFEEGESPYDCVRREVKEETSLTLNKPIYRGIVTELMHLFTCTDFLGEVGECNEGELEWVNISDVVKLPIWEGDKVFLKLLSDNAPFFSLKLKYNGDVLVETVLE